MNKNAHKAHTLIQMARYYNIPMSDVVAFGDGGNDVTMLDIAGTGVAMSNANDTLKDIACVVTDYSNTDNGIVKFLNWYTTKGHKRIAKGVYNFETNLGDNDKIFIK